MIMRSLVRYWRRKQDVRITAFDARSACSSSIDVGTFLLYKNFTYRISKTVKPIKKNINCIYSKGHKVRFTLPGGDRTENISASPVGHPF